MEVAAGATVRFEHGQKVGRSLVRVVVDQIRILAALVASYGDSQIARLVAEQFSQGMRKNDRRWQFVSSYCTSTYEVVQAIYPKYRPSKFQNDRLRTVRRESKNVNF